MEHDDDTPCTCVFCGWDGTYGESGTSSDTYQCFCPMCGADLEAD